MYELKSNFYPATEPKAGYIGKANIVIAGGFRINNISVFHTDENGYSINFAEQYEGHSYIVPKSKEAYAAMLGVVVKAVEAEEHYAFEPGEFGLKFKVRGTKVDEPYADGRYSVEIGDLCTVNGITTRLVEFETEGKERGFVSVDMPAVKDQDGKVRMYTNKDGKEVAELEYRGITSRWKDKEGHDQKLNWKVKLADAVKKERLNLYPELKKTSLKEQVEAAEAEKAEQPTTQKGAKENEIEP